jgi:hypothetical protein
LNEALGNVNNAYWSAFTWFDTSVSPAWTLFVTKKRSVLNTQSQPWPVGTANSQQTVASLMAQIVIGATNQLADGYDGLSTSSAVIEPESGAYYSGYGLGQSYFTAISSKQGPGYENFGGNFAGLPENKTPNHFATSGTVLRSDFYEISPGSRSSTYLGYFEMATNGLLTYVAYPTGVPVIQSISRSNITTTITYTTGTYGTYTLRGTNSLASGVSATNWPVVSTLATGDTSIHTVTDTDASNNKFYIITAQ